MQLIAKKLYLSEDVDKLLRSLAESERRTLSSLADELLRAALKARKAQK